MAQAPRQAALSAETVGIIENKDGGLIIVSNQRLLRLWFRVIFTPASVLRSHRSPKACLSVDALSGPLWLSYM